MIDSHTQTSTVWLNSNSNAVLCAVLYVIGVCVCMCVCVCVYHTEWNENVERGNFWPVGAKRRRSHSHQNELGSDTSTPTSGTAPQFECRQHRCHRHHTKMLPILMKMRYLSEMSHTHIMNFWMKWKCLYLDGFCNGSKTFKMPLPLPTINWPINYDLRSWRLDSLEHGSGVNARSWQFWPSDESSKCQCDVKYVPPTPSHSQSVP